MTLDILDPDGGVRYKGATLEVTRYTYGGGIAIAAVCRDGEPWGTLTVNLVDEDTGKDCVFVKDYSEGAGNVRTLAAAGLIETPPVRWARSGFAEIPLCRLTEKGMQLVREFDAKASAEVHADKPKTEELDGEGT